MAPYDPEKYWDAVADNIASRTHSYFIAGDNEPYYRYKRKQFLKLLGSINFTHKKVLDVGCGPGGNLDFLFSKGCRQLTGVMFRRRWFHWRKSFCKTSPLMS